jgi:hypothetical protein
MKLVVASVLALIAFAFSIPQAQAYTAYNNSVLHGCYAVLSRSVDTESTPTLNRDAVATLCFDGTGHIVGTVGSQHSSGGCENTNGPPGVCHSNVTGTYAVTNTPGDGMGKLNYTSGCGTHAFVVHSVTSGVAMGFYMNYIAGTCAAPHPLVIDGVGVYQGP